MKKIYSNPKLEVVKVATQQMLAGSLDPSKGTGTVNNTSATYGADAEGHGSDFDW